MSVLPLAIEEWTLLSQFPSPFSLSPNELPVSSCQFFHPTPVLIKATGGWPELAHWPLCGDLCFGQLSFRFMDMLFSFISWIPHTLFSGMFPPSDYLQFLPRLHLRYRSFRDSESGLLSSSPPFLHLPNEYLYLFISLSISSPLCCLVKDRNCHIHILNSNT